MKTITCECGEIVKYKSRKPKGCKECAPKRKNKYQQKYREGKRSRKIDSVDYETLMEKLFIKEKLLTPKQLRGYIKTSQLRVNWGNIDSQAVIEYAKLSVEAYERC